MFTGLISFKKEQVKSSTLILFIKKSPTEAFGVCESQRRGRTFARPLKFVQFIFRGLLFT